MAIDSGRLKAIFLAAAEVTDPVSRRELLDLECAEDVWLRHRLELLLEAHDNPAPLVAAPSAAQIQDAPNGMESLDRVGQILSGRYKLMEQIGEGGMGAVWVAEQLEPVRRKVALKLIKAGMDTRSVISRFEAERQALAVMDHPNIAKVLDGGVTETGRPFFVMEYVKGLPFTQYCDQFRLSIADRLKLFVPVCQAVQHAHQKGILHRDLKPSNILICMYDGQPVPKVIDFGLAKAINQPLTERTVYTAHGIMLGTPTYMSPEQAEYNNLDIDTRSDVYSLGVVLYELLTGSTPLEQQRFRDAAWLEVLRLIKEEDPPKPNDRLSGSGSLPSVAAQRHIEPEKLTRLVKGELDWIVMKCLEKDRSRRYDSADGLACDVGRFLDDEIVMAQPPSALYMLKKFVRRNRGRVVATALVFLTLVAGLIGTLFSLAEARRQSEQAVIARENESEQRQRAATAEAAAIEKEKIATQLAESERLANEKAQQRLVQIDKSNQIIQQILRKLNPQSDEKVGELLEESLAQALDFAADALEAESIGDQRTVARMQVTLGVTYQGLGLSGKAIAMLEKAQVTLVEALGADHSETLSCQFNLAESLFESGEHDKAVALHRETLQIRQETLDDRDPDVVSSMAALAECYRKSGDLSRAMPMLVEALGLRKDVLGPEDPATITSMNNLVQAYREIGETGKALALFDETLILQKKIRGENHPETLAVMNNVAVCKQSLGKFDEALALFEEILEKRNGRLGAWHPATLTSMNNLASIWCAKGQLDKSIPLFEELLNKKTEVLTADHPGTLLTAANLAINYSTAARKEEAVPLFQRALDGSKQYPELQWIEPHYAECLRDLGRQDKAIGLLHTLIADARNELPADSLELAARLNRLGWLIVALKLDALDESEQAIRDSLAIREQLDPDAWTTFSSRAALGAVLLRGEQFSEAEPLLVSGYEGMEQLARDIPDTARASRLRETLEDLVQLYRAWSKPDQAAPWQQKLDALKTGSN